MPDSQVDVHVGPRNGKADRLVIFTRNGRELRDEFNTDRAFLRQKSIERAADRFGVAVEDLTHLDGEIVQLADEEDSRQERAGEDLRFEGLTGRELDAAQYETDFLIQDTLVALQPGIVGGAQKTLKSLLSIDAAISLATATPFLGKLAVPRAVSVGYFCGEGGYSVLQDYSRRIAKARDLQLGDIGGLMFFDIVPRLADLSHLDALSRVILDHAMEVVFFDPTYLAIESDNNGSIFAQGKVLRHVHESCIKAGCTPILVHHTKKNVVNPHDPPELSDLSWSGFAEYAGQWWLLSRREKYDADQPGEHRLWLNVGGRAGHSALHALDIHEGSRADRGGRCWGVEVLNPREARAGVQERQREAQHARQEEKQEQNKKLLVRCMAKQREPDSKSAVRERAGLGHGATFERAWGSLLDEGAIVPSGSVKKGNGQVYDAYQLADEEPG